jgi:hypothetical protein
VKTRFAKHRCGVDCVFEDDIFHQAHGFFWKMIPRHTGAVFIEQVLDISLSLPQVALAPFLSKLKKASG